MENNGKVGRPKAQKPRNVQIKITVTEDENLKLENIAKKFGVKKTELLRIFALGTDEKTPSDIYFHDNSFYPFTDSYISFLNHLKEKNLEKIDFKDYDYQDDINYNEYELELGKEKIIEYYRKEYKNLNIKNFKLTTLNELFEKHFMYLRNYDIFAFNSVSNEKMCHKYNEVEYKPNELKEYLLENDEMFKELKDIDENKTIILFYGKNLSLLKIIPYNEKMVKQSVIESLINKTYLKG